MRRELGSGTFCGPAHAMQSERVARASQHAKHHGRKGDEDWSWSGVPTPKKVDGGKDLTGVGPVERIRSPAQLTIHGHSGRRTRIEATAATSGIPRLATSSEFDMVLLQNAPH